MIRRRLKCRIDRGFSNSLLPSFDLSPIHTFKTNLPLSNTRTVPESIFFPPDKQGLRARFRAVSLDTFFLSPYLCDNNRSDKPNEGRMLNYHHLRYFRAIAKEGSLTKAASHLGVSQSSLSVQLRQLEGHFGQPLFLRESKSLILTEAGKIALDYADLIFQSGEELVSVLQNQPTDRRRVIRIGSVATLSRNFQTSCLQPFIGRNDVELVLRSGSLRELLAQLQAHTLDLVLSNLPVRRDSETEWHSHLLEEQEVALIGRKRRSRKQFLFPEDLEDTPLILPSLDSNIRVAFDLLLEQKGIRPQIAAEVDDMAMLRLLARDGAGLALVPPVVVAGELKRGELVEYYRFAEIRESFYAISPTRQFPNPLVAELIEKAAQAI